MSGLPETSLAAARARVLAEVERMPGTLRPPAVRTVAPLRPLPAGLAAKLQARYELGLAESGYPRERLFPQVVLPVAVVAVVDLIVWAFASGNVEIIAGLLFVILVLAGAVTTAYALADPVRLNRAERLILQGCRYWESTQPWLVTLPGRADAGLSSRPERALVSVAVDTVGRIAGTRTWSSGYLDQHRLRLDLISELDQIDAQAYRLAAARADLPAIPDDQHVALLDSAHRALLDRVAALADYAQHLAALDGRLAEVAAANRTEGRIGDLAAASAHDEFAAEAVRELSGDAAQLGSVTLGLLQADVRALTDRPENMS